MNEEILYSGVEYDELGIKYNIVLYKTDDGFRYERSIDLGCRTIPMDIKFNEEKTEE